MEQEKTVQSETKRLEWELKLLVEQHEALQANVKRINEQLGKTIPEIAARKYALAVLQGISGNGKEAPHGDA